MSLTFENVTLEQRVLLHCAEEDEFVPLSRVQETAAALAGVGARTELTTYDDPEHHLNEDSIVRLRRMLTITATGGEH